MRNHVFVIIAIVCLLSALSFCFFFEKNDRHGTVDSRKTTVSQVNSAHWGVVNVFDIKKRILDNLDIFYEDINSQRKVYGHWSILYPYPRSEKELLYVLDGCIFWLEKPEADCVLLSIGLYDANEELLIMISADELMRDEVCEHRDTGGMFRTVSISRRLSRDEAKKIFSAASFDDDRIEGLNADKDEAFDLSEDLFNYVLYFTLPPDTPSDTTTPSQPPEPTP